MRLLAAASVKRTNDGYSVLVNDCEFVLPSDGEMRVGFEMTGGEYMPVNLPIVDSEHPRLFVAFVLTNGELRSLAESGQTIGYEGVQTGLRLSLS